MKPSGTKSLPSTSVPNTQDTLNRNLANRLPIGTSNATMNSHPGNRAVPRETWLPRPCLCSELICRCGFCHSRKVDGNQETVRAVIGKLVAVALESFVFALPHAEAVVGLGAPVFQIVHDNFLTGAITADTLQDHLTLAVVHLGLGHAGLGVNI